MEKYAALEKDFTDAMDNDLNTALAITSVYNVLKSDICDAGKVKLIEDFDSVLSLSLIKEAKALAAHLAEEKKAAAAAPTSLTVTCLTPGVDAEKRADVEKLINDRADAKKAKDFCFSRRHPRQAHRNGSNAQRRQKRSKMGA